MKNNSICASAAKRETVVPFRFMQQFEIARLFFQFFPSPEAASIAGRLLPFQCSRQVLPVLLQLLCCLCPMEWLGTHLCMYAYVHTFIQTSTPSSTYIPTCKMLLLLCFFMCEYVCVYKRNSSSAHSPFTFAEVNFVFKRFEYISRRVLVLLSR